MNARQECVRPRAGKDRVWILYIEMMSIYPRVFQIHTACRWVNLHYPCISVCIYTERHKQDMPYYDVANLVTITKTNMFNEMPCGYGTLGTPGGRIRHQLSRRACAEVVAAFEVSHRAAQRSQQLQQLNIKIVKLHSILNAPPSLQVLSGAFENAVAESKCTLQSSRGGWEHQEVLRSTGEGYQSISEVCVWLPYRIIFCWCNCLKASIWWLIKFHQRLISRCLLASVKVSVFVSFSTCRIFTSSVLRASPLTIAFLLPHPSKKRSLKVW